jgi:hypothetical protein
MTETQKEINNLVSKYKSYLTNPELFEIELKYLVTLSERDQIKNEMLPRSNNNRTN